VGDLAVEKLAHAGAIVGIARRDLFPLAHDEERDLVRLEFTIPKMLRPYFMRNRELLADLARLAYETIQQLLADASGDDNARPRVVAVPQTFRSVLNVHPHAHCLACRGVWNRQGQWLAVADIDTLAAEKLFAHK
jgi:hypothetical protein